MGVKVRILNEEYNLRADEDEGYLEGIAAYVDNKAKGIASSLPHKEREEISILTCLNIADELCKLKEKNRKAKERIQRLIEKIEKNSK